MKLFNVLACALAAGSMMLTSCLSSKNDKQTSTESISECFSYRIDKSNGAVSVDKSNSMVITTNYTDLCMGVTIGSLDVDGTTLPSPTFDNLLLQKNNTGWVIAEATNVRPEVKGFSPEAVPMFDRVRLGSINHLAELNSQTVVGNDRVVRLETGNSIYYVIRKDAWSAGETNVLNTSNPEAQLFKSKRPIYLLKLNPEKMTGEITVHNAIFAPAMENLGLVIQFRDIPFAVEASGRVVLTRNESFDPFSGNTPYPQFPISNLRCVLDPFRGIEISFNCDVKAGSAQSAYRVSADMPFNYGLEIKN